MARGATEDRKRANARSLLIVTGTMGAGKSTVLGEASDILAGRGLVHAAIDVDALGLALLGGGKSNDAVMYGNLRSVCRNYISAGVERFVVARALESHAELESCRRAVPGATVKVCRLAATLETMQGRVKQREPGPAQNEYAARVEKLNLILERVRLEDFVVSNENRPVTAVATEMLVKAGWI